MNKYQPKGEEPPSREYEKPKMIILEQPTRDVLKIPRRERLLLDNISRWQEASARSGRVL